MAKCNWCGKKGLFLRLTPNNVCNSCDDWLVQDVKSKAATINDSIKLVETSKKINIKISRCDLIVERSLQLKEYEDKNIPTLTPLPSVLAARYTEKKDDVIVSHIQNMFTKANQKAAVIDSPKSKISQFQKVLLEVQELKPKLTANSKLDGVEKQVKDAIHNVRLGDLMDKANKFEFKEQYKKALDQYQEALYFVKNDDVDDELKKKEISELESKISDMKSKV